jgi:diaminohydroxyphosphoribosylaminopyrimidine deaminase/5-amino-6-(5-phosphoribosylamino)uracil reductase
MTADETDARFMRQAFELAGRGRGATSPNPLVGAVIVKDGLVVGAGYHERYGGPHAEVNALAEAGARARGATLYVTLEPCSVSGKTPPCTDAILAAGIARTVVTTEDPNPDVSGRGLAILRDAGVRVECGLMSEEALRLNAAYFKFRDTGLPFTTLKLALSLDGRIAPPPGGPRWTSSEESRSLVHDMRAGADCVMVGIGTVLADDPRLTARTDGAAVPPERQPARLILDTRLRIPSECAIVSRPSDARTIVACGVDADIDRAAELERAGLAVWRFETPDGRLDLRAVLVRAAADGLISVLAEGGATVATSLLDCGLVDRVAFFIAPRLYGAAGVPALQSLGEACRGRGPALTNTSWTRIGSDCLFEADVAAPDGDMEEADVHGTR